jgi:hypothetical protein
MSLKITQNAQGDKASIAPITVTVIFADVVTKTLASPNESQPFYG